MYSNLPWMKSMAYKKLGRDKSRRKLMHGKDKFVCVLLNRNTVTLVLLQQNRMCCLCTVLLLLYSCFAVTSSLFLLCHPNWCHFYENSIPFRWNSANESVFLLFHYPNDHAKNVPDPLNMYIIYIFIHFMCTLQISI